MNVELETQLFTNIDNEDFVGKFGGKEKTVPAGATVVLPLPVAELFTKHLVNKVMIKKTGNWSDDVLRAELVEKVKSPPGEKASEEVKVETPVVDKVEELKPEVSEEEKVEVVVSNEPIQKKRGRPKKEAVAV